MQKRNITSIVWLAGGGITLFLLCLFAFQQTESWSEDRARQELLQIAQVAAAGLHPAQIQPLLTADAQTIARLPLADLLQHLNKIRGSDTAIAEVYLMGRKDGKIIFLADADNALGEGPFNGEPYPGASAELKQVFRDGKPFIEGPLTDQWGSWVSALAPIPSNENQDIVALLGIDIDERTWLAMVGGLPKTVGESGLLALLLYLAFCFYVLRKTRQENSLLAVNQQLQLTCQRLEHDERMLRENESLWKNALWGGDFRVWEWDLESDETIFPGGSDGKADQDTDGLRMPAEDWQKTVHPKDLPAVMAAIQSHIEGKTPYFKVEFRQQRHDGLSRWYVSRGQISARDPDNRATRLFGVYADITERKHAEMRLRDDRQRLFEMFDALPALVYLVGPDYKIRFANRRLRDSLGEPGNIPCHKFLCLENKPCSECLSQRLFSDGSLQVIHKRFANGHHYEVYHYPFGTQDGTPQVLVMALDLTERYKTRDSQSQSTPDQTDSNALKTFV